MNPSICAKDQKYDKLHEIVFIKEIDIPTITENEVLVKVKAAAVNPLDIMILHGDVKAIVPYKMPMIAGNEFSGEIVSVGEKVKSFKIGDRVFARLPLDKIGAFAEYVAVDQDAIAKIPEYLTWNEASAIPLTALTAMQALDLLKARKGESIFISGGSGSLGAMLIPIAYARELHIATSGNSRSRDRLVSLGVNDFFDYKTQDYSKELRNIDYVIDTIGGAELEKEYQILKSGGKLISLRAMPDRKFGKRLNMSWLKCVLFTIAGMKYNFQARKHNATYDFLFVQADGMQLSEAASILESSKIYPSIDKVYPFTEINQAISHVAHGSSNGKTIIEIQK